MENNMTDFYIDCVKAYHDTVKQLGCVQNGIIHIPDLLPVGQKMTLAYLQDRFLQSEFSHDPETYYYVVMTFVLQCGIIFADKWHQSMDHLKGTEFIDQVITDGPWDYVEPILIDTLEMDADSFNLLCRHVYDNLLQKMNPIGSRRMHGIIFSMPFWRRSSWASPSFWRNMVFKHKT